MCCFFSFDNVVVVVIIISYAGAENGVTLEAGDTLLGDCKRDACAEAVVQSLLNENCKNVAFSIVSNEEPALSEEQWTSSFGKL